MGRLLQQASHRWLTVVQVCAGPPQALTDLPPRDRPTPSVSPLTRISLDSAIRVVEHVVRALQTELQNVKGQPGVRREGVPNVGLMRRKAAEFKQVRSGGKPCLGARRHTGVGATRGSAPHGGCV